MHLQEDNALSTLTQETKAEESNRKQPASVRSARLADRIEEGAKLLADFANS